MKRLALAIASFSLLAACDGGGGPPGACPFAASDCRTGAGSPAGPPSSTVFKFESTGANVFTTPDRIARYRVVATTPSVASAFSFYFNNELQGVAVLGSSSVPPDFLGIYLIPARTLVEVRQGTGVTWSFTEVP